MCVTCRKKIYLSKLTVLKSAPISSLKETMNNESINKYNIVITFQNKVFLLQLYPFSMAEISWDEYFEEYLAGIRRYLFKESDDTLPHARIKWKRYTFCWDLLNDGILATELLDCRFGKAVSVCDTFQRSLVQFLGFSYPCFGEHDEPSPVSGHLQRRHLP